ncbi:MAG: DUF72 domain-containing protein [Chloroflexi bacterium]|nr:DUF72 domain-containing protein [Chloroflexota bacterium]
MEGSNWIRIGTSGWHYAHWVGPFYPPGTPPERFLGYYGRYFDTVEINNTFYRLPAEPALAAWRATVPPGFIFAVKASRYITHVKKLNEPERTTGNFLDKVELLGEKLGPVLFQMPPHWRANAGRLRSFLEVLPPRFRYVFEFRDPTWFQEPVYETLARRNAAFCIWTMGESASPRRITGDTAYIRFHGPDGAYRGRYGESLKGWAEFIAGLAAKGVRVHCYFNNDEAGNAVQDALRLREMLDIK